MRERLLQIMVCPACQGSLALKVLEHDSGSDISAGVLRCDCGEAFPIWRGIPRVLRGWRKAFPEFLDRYGRLLELPPNDPFGDRPLRTHEDFEYHWRKFGSAVVNPSKLAAAREFLQGAFGDSLAESMVGQLVLDAGCGDGVHEHVLREAMCEVVAADPTPSVDAARGAHLECEGIHFVQADLFWLPFRPKTFDRTISVGVLYYTPDPSGGFNKLVELTKIGGTVAIWMYPKRGLVLDKILLGGARAMTRLLPEGCLYTLCLASVPLLRFLPTYSGVTLANSSWRECAEILHVHLRPRYLFAYDEKDVRQWFLDNGLGHVHTFGTPLGLGGVRTEED